MLECIHSLASVEERLEQRAPGAFDRPGLRRPDHRTPSQAIVVLRTEFAVRLP
jgi:hypothetical protein